MGFIGLERFIDFLNQPTFSQMSIISNLKKIETYKNLVSRDPTIDYQIASHLKMARVFKNFKP